MKVLLAIDEDPPSDEAGGEVAGRSWEAGTTVRVLHAVGKFVPPAQELGHDAATTMAVFRRVRDEVREWAGEFIRERGGGGAARGEAS